MLSARPVEVTGVTVTGREGGSSNAKYLENDLVYAVRAAKVVEGLCPPGHCS